MPEHPAPPPVPGHPPAPAARQDSLARAGRHAVLRRLAPALRHDLVVHLQSLGMMAESLGARLDRGNVPAPDVQGAVGKLNRLSRQAVDAALAVSSWIQPPEDDEVALGQGVDECVGLLASNLNFRGYTLRNDGVASAWPVRHSDLRYLLCAALLTLADRADGPGEVVVRAGAAEGEVLAEYRPQPERDAPWLDRQAKEALDWHEIEALAAQAGAQLQPAPGDALLLRMPRADVTGPLKMAPV